MILLTRLPLPPSHLYSFDSVNLALALEDFDPARNQPQPTGYPLFVAEARLLYRAFQDPERTFAALNILISTLAVVFLYLLGKRMYCAWIGTVAAALLFVNPPFWYSGLTSPLRLHLAFLSVLVAYFCWRAVAGEPKYFYVASIRVGIGKRISAGIAAFPSAFMEPDGMAGPLQDFFLSRHTLAGSEGDDLGRDTDPCLRWN